MLAYYRSYLSIAAAHGLGFIFESPTWRASSDWGDKLGYSAAALADVNRRSIDLMVELRDAHQTKDAPMVISGCVGPRGDGYDPGRLMNVAQAEAYHASQIATFSETQADMVTAITMTNANEAIGITRAAVAAGMPVAISFTLETDGCLPTGQSLEDAIGAVDTATRRAPAYYMINCAHPTHFESALPVGADWVQRLRGIRANASQRSHAELDQAKDLDAGDPAELGRQYRTLRHEIQSSQRARRLLRDRPSSRRADLPGLRRGSRADARCAIAVRAPLRAKPTADAAAHRPRLGRCSISRREAD